MSAMAESWSKVASLFDGPRAVDVPLASVARLTLTKRSLTAPRRHVLVEMGDGVRARFLVNGAKGVLERLAVDARTAGAALEVVGLG
jgi:hypothetical protein